MLVETDHRWVPDHVKIIRYIALPFAADFVLFGVIQRHKSPSLLDVTSKREASVQ